MVPQYQSWMNKTILFSRFLTGFIRRVILRHQLSAAASSNLKKFTRLTMVKPPTTINKQILLATAQCSRVKTISPPVRPLHLALLLEHASSTSPPKSLLDSAPTLMLADLEHPLSSSNMIEIYTVHACYLTYLWLPTQPRIRIIRSTTDHHLVRYCRMPSAPSANPTNFHTVAPNTTAFDRTELHGPSKHGARACFPLRL